MRIELAQLPCVDGDLDQNLQQALAAIGRCGADSDLVVFPETYLSGFPTADTVAALSQPLDGPAVTALADAVRRQGVAAAIGLAEAAGDGRFYNTTVLLTPEGGRQVYRKVHMWASDQGVFSPGDRVVCGRWRDLRLGALICYDIEFPESARALAALDADLLLVTDGNMEPYGPVHRRAIAARAMENQMFAVLVNRCDHTADYDFPGESMVVDPFGEVVAELGAGPEQRAVDLDLTALARCRAHYDYRGERRIALAGRIEAGPGDERAFVPLSDNLTCQPS